MKNIYISMLRGINVSGQKMIKMEALRHMYESLGFENIQSYIQSGNVVFKSENKNTQELEGMIVQKIKNTFNFDVPVMVKDCSEIETVLNHNPFMLERNEDPSLLHVTFLNEEPDKAGIDKIKAGTYGTDEYIIKGKTVYLFCPNGYGKTKLNNNFFENKLKTTATTRNWKTIIELVKISNNN